MKSLLIGCGKSREKRIIPAGDTQDWGELTTLDIDPDTGCDIVHDLRFTPYPFQDNTFDQIHAYEVLEHCGMQGEYRLLFDQFNEFWRILKPNGLFAASVPSHDSIWAWGDPGHTRVISAGTLAFLDQRNYTQVGTTSMTDYRFCYHGNFKCMSAQNDGGMFFFLLKAIK